MLLGTDVNAALAILEGMGIDVIGLELLHRSRTYARADPNPGRDCHAAGLLHPQCGTAAQCGWPGRLSARAGTFCRALLEFVEKITSPSSAGCCGTTPAHLKLLVEQIERLIRIPATPSCRGQARLGHDRHLHAAGPSPTLLGERCNAQGSRKFKKMLLEEDYDGILELARDQVAGGAHALDISCAVTERPDEIDLMRKVVKKLEMGVDVPLVIDTTELDVLEAALKTAPGPLPDQLDASGSGARKSRQGLQAGKGTQRGRHPADHRRRRHGQDAATKSSRSPNASIDIAVNDHGLRPQDLVFDALTFTLATGDAEFANSAIETIEGIRLDQAEPAGRADLARASATYRSAWRPRPGRC